jgi:Multidrug resistance efflux pump
MDTKEKNRKGNNMLIAFIILLAAIGLVALAGFFFLKPKDAVIQGQAEATEVRVSSKIAGRIQELRVKEGEKVQIGDTLAILYSPEVNAKLLQAQSAKDAAKAQSDKAIKGAREEQVTAAYASWQKAQAGLEIAKRSYERLQNLYDKGVVSAQKRDEAEANFKSMQATEQAAQAQYLMARNGSEKEDKEAAFAWVNKAEGALAEVEAYIEETYLIASLDGQISEIFPKVGELVGTGAPIMNILDNKDQWVVFNVREDLLKDMQVGNKLKAYVPALDSTISLTVYYLKEMGSYASWKATKTTGQYDLKTFEVKTRPETFIEGLYPGMSVIIK